MKKRKSCFLFVLLAGCLFLPCSCSKESEKDGAKNDKKTVMAEIPVYKTKYDAYRILNDVSGFDSIEQLIQYEKVRGMQSAGRLSEEFYSNINTDGFTTHDEALSYVMNNSRYLDIVAYDEDMAVLPKWKDTPLRYLANIDGLFMIGDMVYRLFSESYVVTTSDNLEILRNLDESKVNTLCDDSQCVVVPYYTTPSTKGIHDNCNQSGYIRKAYINGTNQIIIKILTHSLVVDDPERQDPDHEDYFMDFTLLNLHKVLGIWWEQKHHTTVNGTVKVHKRTIDDSDWSVEPKSIIKPKTYLSSWTKSIYDIPAQPLASNPMHVYGYDVTATAMNIGTVHMVGGN